MRQEMTALQRLLEAKERKMGELLAGGQAPALKQHYDRVLKDLQAERDALVVERAAIMSKLDTLKHAADEERKRMEVCGVAGEGERRKVVGRERDADG